MPYSKAERSRNWSPIVAASGFLLLLPHSARAQSDHFTSYAQVASSDLPRTVLRRVLARDGRSKRYSDLLPLDGGTVGIANFARGGLASLYRRMDTAKYFSRDRSEMIGRYSAACRPKGKTGNDIGWGCYSKAWWRQGMAAFLASPEAPGIQEQAWLDLMEPSIVSAVAHGWTDRRSLAIAMGVTNSMGTAGFTSLAVANGWQPERVLKAYVGHGNQHRNRRMEAVDSVFPSKNR